MIFNKDFPATIFAFLFILILYLMWQMFHDLVGAFFMGMIIAGSCYRIFTWTYATTGLKKEWASALICLLVIIVLFLPLIYIGIQLSGEAVGAYNLINQSLNHESINDFLHNHASFSFLSKKISAFLGVELGPEVIKEKLGSLVSLISQKIVSFINAWIGNFVGFIIHSLITIFTVHVLFTYGDELKKFIFKLSPLPDDQEQLLLDRFNQMNYVTLVCNGVGGLIQGILAGIMFWILGIPSVLLWSTIMVILGFIPLLGISVIYIPVCIYLFIQGAVIKSIVLFIWCTLVALIVENWFKPQFIGKRIKLNSFFVMICIIGGMSAFDMAGIFYGPVIGILFLTLVELYHQFYLDKGK
ncbi:MAG: hypothetical protein A2381_19115 [Bdellovibrionales bacterium RIFOXYB1_FULL_37_110]|nr:MAG: hypothetical protein A2181_09385 [Bdellovibrionales bacterium RIFOXYA1_FULL_38_20]OFZ49490.1 MAG: hypothetical protein A2417_04265 [Bdellovibrionales bacterium RIFOXYC1_FULL_37_79]OFZ58644.1 MAG: hypothetical protein A2381_19115 [Bdellovibrionales bacterium RIFOXYB1_FULL_37_110]OFZ63385.1 MAG: hypothetical protein A2577_17375 [Bdellovibrionales bacterium RIFOXYD1_FULL_36_51]